MNVVEYLKPAYSYLYVPRRYIAASFNSKCKFLWEEMVVDDFDYVDWWQDHDTDWKSQPWGEINCVGEPTMRMLMTNKSYTCSRAVYETQGNKKLSLNGLELPISFHLWCHNILYIKAACYRLQHVILNPCWFVSNKVISDNTWGHCHSWWNNLSKSVTFSIDWTHWYYGNEMFD